MSIALAAVFTVIYFNPMILCLDLTTKQLCTMMGVYFTIKLLQDVFQMVVSSPLVINIKISGCHLSR